MNASIQYLISSGIPETRGHFFPRYVGNKTVGFRSVGKYEAEEKSSPYISTSYFVQNNQRPVEFH